MRKPLRTTMKARIGAHTIGSLRVSGIFPAKIAGFDLGDDDEFSCSPRAGVLFCWPLSVESNERSRIVIGTTVRLMTRLAAAIGIALSPPSRSPRTAGPTKGTAGAEAVNAASALVLTRMRKMKREIRNTTR